MLNTKQEKIIEKYVNDKYYDVARLKKYLSMHAVVGNEVFGYCDRHILNKKESTYSKKLDDERGYLPLDVDTFLRRVPFYFYVAEDIGQNTFCDLHFVIPESYLKRDSITPEELENFYNDLEFMYYKLNLSLVDIFNYGINQGGSGQEIFPKWRHYLHLCVDNLGWTDFMPERFITKYNEALERCDMPPVIYEIQEVGMAEPFWREGRKIEFRGQFPCDDAGNPILRWIGINIKNAESIFCDCKRSKTGILSVVISPETEIQVLNFYNDDKETDDYWYRVYAGPMRMRFDHNALKYHRSILGLTQKEVADAIGAAVRTYQKWENGTTTPDGHYLLRLMNWLDISSVQDLIIYD